MSWFTDVFVGGIVYDLFKYVIAPFIVMLLATSIFKYVFNLLKEWRETIVFCLATFLIVTIMFYFMGSKRDEPNFVGSIQNVLVGDGGTENDQIAVLSIFIVNSGSAQSIASNWKVTASLNGNNYEAVPTAMPKDFTFKLPAGGQDQPLAVTYHNSDVMLDKQLIPVQPGAAQSGILFVVFHNIQKSLFASGPQYTVTFNDAFSRKYTLTMQGSAKIGSVGLLPGIHMEAQCPVPFGKVPDPNLKVSTPTSP